MNHRKQKRMRQTLTANRRMWNVTAHQGEDGMGIVELCGSKYQAIQARHKHKFSPRKGCYGRARIAFEIYSAQDLAEF